MCIWNLQFVRNADSEGSASLAATMLERKLVVVEIEKQPTYGDFVEYAFAHCKNDLAIITNADIYFDRTLECVAKNVDEMRKNQMMISLTRTASQECPQHVRQFTSSLTVTISSHLIYVLYHNLSIVMYAFAILLPAV